MLATCWPDDIRRRDGKKDRPVWHYINFPFKPEGEPESIEPKPLHPVKHSFRTRRE